MSAPPCRTASTLTFRALLYIASLTPPLPVTLYIRCSLYVHYAILILLPPPGPSLTLASGLQRATLPR